MSEVVGNLSTGIADFYNIFLSGMPSGTQKIINLLLVVILVVIYAILIWKFYRWISKREILKLSVWIKSRTSSPGGSKFLGGIFYLIENLVFLPVIIFLWFLFVTIFLIFLTQGMEVGTVLTLSAIIITAIRMSSYYKEEVARELAKMLPLTLLAVALTQYGTFNFSEIIKNISLIPNYISEIWIYFIFIFVVEFILTLFDLIFRYFRVSEDEIALEDENKG
jgi:hypothetical protein